MAPLDPSQRYQRGGTSIDRNQYLSQSQADRSPTPPPPGTTRPRNSQNNLTEDIFNNVPNSGGVQQAVVHTPADEVVLVEKSTELEDSVHNAPPTNSNIQPSSVSLDADLTEKQVPNSDASDQQDGSSLQQHHNSTNSDQPGTPGTVAAQPGDPPGAVATEPGDLQGAAASLPSNTTVSSRELRSHDNLGPDGHASGMDRRLPY